MLTGALAAAAIAGGSVATAPAALAADSCGLSVGVVLDATMSYTETEFTDEKAQAASFVQALGEGPGMIVAGSAFGYTAPLWGPGDPGTSMGVDESLTAPNNATFTGLALTDEAAVQDASNRFLAFTRESVASTRTNWEAGLRSMSGTGVQKVVFITDGVPNAWGSTAADLGTTPDISLNQQALDGAAAAIADLRAEGIEVIPLFVKTSQPGLRGINDPINPTPAADIERAMQVLDPAFTIDNALSIEDVSATMISDVTRACTPALALDKSHTYEDTNGDGKPNAGDTLVYSFKVTNTGQTPLNTLNLVDEKLTSLGITWSYPVGFDGTLAQDESVTATAAPYVITAADELVEEIHNVATVTAVNPWNPNNNPPKQTDIDDQPVVGKPPVIDLIKTIKEITDVNANGITDKGDVVVYGFTGTNPGTVGLTDVTLTDAMLSAVSPTPVAITADPAFDGTLAPGASTTWTSGDYTLTQANVDAGLVQNTAELTGVGTDKNKTPVKDVDSAEVTPDVLPAIGLEKTAHLNDANGDGDADTGETVIYNFVAINTGNVTLHDVKLTDIKLQDAGVGVTAPEGFNATLAPGESVTYESGAYTVNDVEAAAGSVDNTAEVSGLPPVDPDGKVTAKDDATLPSITSPATAATFGSGFAPASGASDGTANLAAVGGLLGLLGAGIGFTALKRRRDTSTLAK